MMGWQWHQLNHMQAICNLLQKITRQHLHQSDFYDTTGEQNNTKISGMTSITHAHWTETVTSGAV